MRCLRLVRLQLEVVGFEIKEKRAVHKDFVMIIQYASDLHLKRSANFRHVMQGGIAPAGDVLVLAGDVANLFDLERCGCFWDWCSEHFKQTIFVPGNHDYYGTWSSAAQLTESFCRSIRSNVFCCNNHVVSIGQTSFICSTLWSRVSEQQTEAVEQTLLDFKEIEICGAHLTVADFNALFEACFGFVQRAVESSEAEKLVVVSHHVPSLSAVADRRKESSVSSGFVTELDNWISGTSVRYWIFGHSHDSLEAVSGAVRLVSNQLGTLHGGKPKDFVREKVFEI